MYSIIICRAWALWEQFQKKAQLYRSNVILVPHGDDFRYDSLSEWDKQLGNLEKLMTYMNADHDMNIKVSLILFKLKCLSFVSHSVILEALKDNFTLAREMLMIIRPL